MPFKPNANDLKQLRLEAQTLLKFFPEKAIILAAAEPARLEDTLSTAAFAVAQLYHYGYFKHTVFSPLYSMYRHDCNFSDHAPLLHLAIQHNLSLVFKYLYTHLLPFSRTYLEGFTSYFEYFNLHHSNKVYSDLDASLLSKKNYINHIMLVAAFYGDFSMLDTCADCVPCFDTRASSTLLIAEFHDCLEPTICEVKTGENILCVLLRYPAHRNHQLLTMTHFLSKNSFNFAAALSMVNKQSILEFLFIELELAPEDILKRLSIIQYWFELAGFDKQQIAAHINHSPLLLFAIQQLLILYARNNTVTKSTATYEACVQWLLHHGANVNPGGFTPLHALCRSQLDSPAVLDLVQQLHLAGADIDAVDTGGCSPLYYAKKSASPNKIHYLVSHGASSLPPPAPSLSQLFTRPRSHRSNEDEEQCLLTTLPTSPTKTYSSINH